MPCLTGLARLAMCFGACALIGACARGQVDAGSMRLDTADLKSLFAGSDGEVIQVEPGVFTLRERDKESAVVSVQRAIKALNERGFSACGQVRATFDRVPKLIDGHEYVAEQYAQGFSRRRSDSIEIASLVSVAWLSTPPPGVHGVTVQIKVIDLPARVFDVHHDRRSPKCGIEALVSAEQGS